MIRRKIIITQIINAPNDWPISDVIRQHVKEETFIDKIEVKITDDNWTNILDLGLLCDCGPISIPWSNWNFTYFEESHSIK